jgi:uncharacterized protein (UPF0335 family)
VSGNRIFCAKCDAAGLMDGDLLPAGWERHTSGMTKAALTVCGGCAEKSRGQTIRSGDAGATDDQLRLFIERVERLEEEEKGIKDDKRDVYLEAKSQGYDPKIMREVVKLRRMNPHDRAERDAILEIYRSAIGLT